MEMVVEVADEVIGDEAQRDGYDVLVGEQS